ncbi:transcriptional regulator [Ureibacillus endophyticus]|uniref:Transcriptional regulator n=1 Tax=Ureibacillus endophyticus TaxID=1978490 RepID=A0A494YTR1_9BACL|nr:transcriptional regulator [Lysinibacillus endophyticus]RKQ13456.1 transcriptional regulator [Lysinibacillus endophyticus]
MDEFTPKQAADFLEINPETLKKYALLLEQNGHNVHRNGRNHRIYNGTDIALIKAMIILNRDKSVNLEHAAGIVTSSDTDIEAIIGDSVTNNDVIEPVQSVIPLHVTYELQALRSFLEKQQVDNEALREEIKWHNQLLTDFQERVSDKLDEQAELIKEQNKQILELKKELNEAKEQPKSVWARLFGK